LRQSANIRKDESSGVTLFFGQKMRIKNWNKFQHFKDRKPPWVKLYRDLLDDIEWHELDAQASKVLVMLWLIASEEDGKVPSSKTLAFRLRMSEKQTMDCLNKLSHWLEHDDISAISDRYQDDGLETETETETKKEKETKKIHAPKGVSIEIWNSFVAQRKANRAVITETVIRSIEREAVKAGWSLEQALAECAARGWRGFKAEWVMEKQNLTKSGISNQTVMSGLTRGLMGGGNNVKLLSR
jgi:hypothetical protein